MFDERYPDVQAVPSDIYGGAGHDIRAGNRAPDAPALIGKDAPSRLFDIFNPAQHTILIFAASQPACQKAREILKPFSALDVGLYQKVLIVPSDKEVPEAPLLGVKYAVTDSEGHAFGGYGILPDDETPTIVIVRPDAMIGALLTSEAGARKYFSLVFKSDT